jgi:hypothetical protein
MSEDLFRATESMRRALTSVPTPDSLTAFPQYVWVDADAVRRVLQSLTGGQQGEARPAREDDGERDTLRALLREARTFIAARIGMTYGPGSFRRAFSEDELSNLLERIDAALADGGAR